jgi:hypothetical protein
MDFLRELSIGINYVEIAVEFAIFIYFLKNYLMKRISGTLLSSIGIIFLAITRSFYMVFDYYIPNFLYLLLAWIFLYSALIVLAMSLFKGVSRSIFHNFPYKRIYFSSIIVYVLILLALRQLNAIFFYICTIGIGILLAIPLLFKFNKLVGSNDVSLFLEIFNSFKFGKLFELNDVSSL